ncbi:MAG TPA: 30S ribosomal protein S21 [Candidatus Dadabacteria bacterium]|jgi:small subunit ribosomal protein S21|nr:30S ribosomal protein S21 [Candidatus Dadabacteria bacterium]
MTGIYVGNNESLENALRRFKRQVEKGGILSDAKKKEYFEKPSETKKKKLFAAKKRLKKKVRKPR